LVFAAFHTSVFSTALLFVPFAQWPSLAVEAPYHMRAVAQRHSPVEMFVNRSAAGKQQLVAEQSKWKLMVSWRTLRSNLLFTSMAVLSLALGIGANTAIYRSAPGSRGSGGWCLR